MRSTMHRSAFLASMLTVGAASTALAVPLPPGTVDAPLPGTTAAAEPALGAVNLATTIQPFEIFGAGGALLFKGELTCSVGKSNVTGTLLFTFRVRNTVAGLNGIVSRVEVEDYRGYAINANWRADGIAGTSPRFADRNGSGTVVNYDFVDPQLFSGAESRFFFAFTDATEYNADGVATIYLTGGQFATVRVFAPGAPCDSCRGDVNGDGVVNFADLNEVLAAFGTNCPTPSIPNGD